MAITAGTSILSPIDFGVSEWLSNKLGTQVGAYNPAQSAQARGAQVFTPVATTPIGGGNAAINSPIPTQISSPTKQVLGAQDTAANSNKNSNNNSNNNGNNPQEPTPAGNNEIMRAAEGAYSQAMDYLGQAEGAIRSAQGGVEQGIGETYNQNLGVAQSQKAQTERAITSEKQSADVRLQNAITAARQALAESMQGGKQRFGTGSNIYKALGEYGTTKFQQAQGQARDVAEQTMQKLNEGWQTFQENYTNQITSLNNWKNQSLRDAQNEFQNKLLEVSRMRNEAGNLKAQTQIQALQNYNATLNAIKMQTYQTQLQLQANAQSAGQQYQSLIKQLGSGTQTGATNTGAAGAQQTAGINMNPITASTETTTGTPVAYTGAIKKNQDQLFA